MFYEDVKVKAGETLSSIAIAYGYSNTNWDKIWKDAQNKALVDLRQVPNKLQVDDVIFVPIPWSITQKTITKQPQGAGWNLTSLNAVAVIGPRDATSTEIAGHLNLLTIGNGLGPLTYQAAGWSFRQGM